MKILISLIAGFVALVAVGIFGSLHMEAYRDDVRAGRIATVENMRPPRLVVLKSELDFGRVDIGGQATCGLVIRNEGERRLELSAVTPAPDGLEVIVGDGEVREGEMAPVNILWKPGSRLGPFSERVTLKSNDTERPEVTVTVTGISGVALACAPPQVAAGEIAPHQAKTVTAMVYSNDWDDVTIKEILASSEKLKWTIEEASADAAKQKLAKWAKTIQIEIPAGLGHGAYHETLRITAAPASDPEKTQQCKLAVQGRVLRRLAVYGEVDHRAVVDVGKIMQGDGKQLTLTLKVRDEQLDLPLKNLEVYPEFVHVDLKPYKSEKLGDGMYHLNVEVPKDAPLCLHSLEGKLGKIHLEFDHPRITELDLKLAFAVDPRW